MTKPKQLENLAQLERALGHTFAHKELLVQALTHRSYAYELATETTGSQDPVVRTDNERLEFLGDAILGLVVSEALYRRHPEWQEGELTRMRAQLVSRQNMAVVAAQVGLGDHLLLGRGEEHSGGRRKAVILANAMEAVIAAMFLDSRAGAVNGDLHSLRTFADRCILGSAEDLLAEELRAGAALGDHKSALQMHLQATHLGFPVYRVESESGPDHRKRFQVEVCLRSADGEAGEVLAAGSGATKKKAEQQAARKALMLLQSHDATQVPARSR